MISSSNPFVRGEMPRAADLLELSNGQRIEDARIRSGASLIAGARECKSANGYLLSRIAMRSSTAPVVRRGRDERISVTPVLLAEGSGLDDTNQVGYRAGVSAA